MTLDIVSPNEWGAEKDYDTWTDRVILKDGIVWHWNGPPITGFDDGQAREQTYLKAVERYHLTHYDPPWRGFAYGFAVAASGTVYRGRGWNQYAAHRGDVDDDGIPDNHEKIPVLWCIGEGQTPTSAMKYAAVQLKAWLESSINHARLIPAARGNLPVFGHRDIGSTTCPGDIIYGYIQDRIWEVDGVPIMGVAIASQAQALARAVQVNAAAPFINALIPLAYQLAPTLGVRPDVLVAQSAKETGWGHFGGDVLAGQHNWSGIKTSDSTGFHTFADHAEGVLAQAQHLALYAGSLIPSHQVVDPRHFARIRGTAPTVEMLSNRWSTEATYGQSIVSGYLAPMIAAVPAPGSQLQVTITGASMPPGTYDMV